MQKPKTGQKTTKAPQAFIGKTILLIDADEKNHLLHQFYLDQATFLSTPSILHGIWLVQELEIDLVLTEIYFNGYTIYDHLFMILKEKMVPIIIQTCQLPQEHKENCIIHGAEAYFQKPIHWPDYLKTITKCLTAKT